MILVLGTVTLDTVEVGGAVHRDLPGGSALFFAAAAARFARVRVVGVVGPDYPMEAMAPLRHLGVDLDGIRDSPLPSQRWHARYGAGDDERSTVVSDRRILEGFRPELEPAEVEARVVFLGSIDPEIQRHVLDQVRDPTLVALDSMGHWIASKGPVVRSLLPEVDILLGTEEEVCALGEEADWRSGAKALLAKGAGTVVAKGGPHGACLVTGEGEVCEDGVSATVVDPTGAGDAFAGGLIGYLASEGNGPDPSAALKAGTRAGARAVSGLSWSGLADRS